MTDQPPNHFLQSLIPEVTVPPELRFSAMETQVASLINSTANQDRELADIKASVKDVPVVLERIVTKLDYTIDDVRVLKANDITHASDIRDLKANVKTLQETIIPDGKPTIERIKEQIGMQENGRRAFWTTIMDKCFWPAILFIAGGAGTAAWAHLDLILKIVGH